MHQKLQSTKFIKLNTNKCQACWKCIEICKKKVPGKLKLLFHKHALISRPDDCTGCLKCVKVCKYDALKATA